MCPLTAADVLGIWEAGEGRRPLDQALTILAAACPDQTVDRLADLSLGRRDRLLLTLRQWLFGPQLHGFVECPTCQERLEFRLTVPAICGAPPADAGLEAGAFCSGRFELQFRLPNSRDLAAVAACNDPQHARRVLIERCLHDARREGAAIAVAALPETVLADVATRMAECDPLQEILIDLTCPACGSSWQSLFDIVTYFWCELAVYSRRLLREVHALARAYGWRESEILAMSPRRRQSYLELVSS